MESFFRDRVALITGGGTGIGKGIARCLFEEGASVVLAQRRVEMAQDAARQLDPTGARARAIRLDISQKKELEEAVGLVMHSFGKIDILVNNASITGRPAIRPFLDMEEAFVHRVVDVNLKGTIFCSQAVARVMKQNGGGTIIHISSVGAFAAQESASVYCATKAAYTGLTRAMALELIPHRIRVNCIAPGDIEIETNREVLSDLRATGVSGDYFRRIPAARRGSPEEIGRVAAFLASDDSSYVVGETVVVDGGFLIY